VRGTEIAISLLSKDQASAQRTKRTTRSRHCSPRPVSPCGVQGDARTDCGPMRRIHRPTRLTELVQPMASLGCIGTPILRTRIKSSSACLHHFRGDRYPTAPPRHHDDFVTQHVIQSRQQPKTPYRRTSVLCFQTEDIINDLLSLFGAQYEHGHPRMRRRKHHEQGR
jgi:hypothetical protein